MYPIACSKDFSPFHGRRSTVGGCANSLLDARILIPQTLGCFAFDETAGEVFVKDAGDEGLVRHAFLDSPGLNADQIPFGQPDVDALIFVSVLRANFCKRAISAALFFTGRHSPRS